MSARPGRHGDRQRPAPKAMRKPRLHADSSSTEAFAGDFVNHPGSLSCPSIWVQVSEFDAGVARGELPVDLPLIIVGCALPGSSSALRMSRSSMRVRRGRAST